MESKQRFFNYLKETLDGRVIHLTMGDKGHSLLDLITLEQEICDNCPLHDSDECRKLGETLKVPCLDDSITLKLTINVEQSVIR